MLHTVVPSMKQTRMLEADTAAITTGGSLNVDITAQRAHNVHGLIAEVNIESEAMDANSNGHWAVYLLPGDIIANGQLLSQWSQWDDENVTQYLWGQGLWMASNQTPFHMKFAPKTSRNVTKGGRVVLRVWVEGTLPVLTNNRVNAYLMYFADQ